MSVGVMNSRDISHVRRSVARQAMDASRTEYPCGISWRATAIAVILHYYLMAKPGKMTVRGADRDSAQPTKNIYSP